MKRSKWSLFPTESTVFYDLFEEHAKLTHEAALLVKQLFEEPGRARELAAKVKGLEHRGDQITHRTIEELRSTFLTPFDRGDLHRMISRLDDILDLEDSTAERVWLYELDEPAAGVHELSTVLLKAVKGVQRGVSQLRNIGDHHALTRTCREINEHENEGDALIRRSVAQLFREQSDPILVVKWKEIYDYLEDAIDRCEDVANVLEGVALEHS